VSAFMPDLRFLDRAQKRWFTVASDAKCFSRFAEVISNITATIQRIYSRRIDFLEISEMFDITVQYLSNFVLRDSRFSGSDATFWCIVIPDLWTLMYI
jgi:hypothetical protein